MVSCSIALDQSPQSLATRLSNKLYENCRAKKMSIPNFPDFSAPISALRNGEVQEATGSFQVCRQQGTALQVLESFATKFMESDLTKDDVMRKITEHNAVFNPNGDFVAGTRHGHCLNLGVTVMPRGLIHDDPWDMRFNSNSHSMGGTVVAATH